MRLTRQYGTLKPGDTFMALETEWLVLDHPSESEMRNGTVFNAVSTDGTKKRLFDDDASVKATRLKVHALDLRQGDQVTMDRNIDIAFNVSTVLKVWGENGYRHARIARPMISASGFGTTCPTAQVHIEQYDSMVRENDRKRDEYYYVVGIDSGALYDSHSFNFSADLFRMAVYLRANGDEREMAEILCEDYRSVREKVTGFIYDRLKDRQDVPEFPDRKDDDERIYEKNLRDRGRNERDLSKHEVRYLNLRDARTRHFDASEVKVLNKAGKF